VRVGPTTELGSPIRQHPQQRDLILIEEGQDLVVEQIRRINGILRGVQLGEGDRRVGIDKGLLVDASHALEGADVEGILRAQVSVAFTV
jgi:hypothetical protein